jgi:hypothetical protein
MAVEQEDDTADLEIMPTMELEKLLHVDDEPAREIDTGREDPGFDPYNRV